MTWGKSVKQGQKVLKNGTYTSFGSGNSDMTTIFNTADAIIDYS